MGIETTSTMELLLYAVITDCVFLNTFVTQESFRGGGGGRHGVFIVTSFFHDARIDAVLLVVIVEIIFIATKEIITTLN